ncbi:putative HORMA domain superfamily protein [Helianthus anomalus]
MIIDIILVQEMGQNRSGYGALVETVIERWAVQYEYSRASQSQSSESYKKTYKKSIILLRSLYNMMRLLPAYRAYRTKVKAQHGHLSVPVKYRESLSDFNLETSAYHSSSGRFDLSYSPPPSSSYDVYSQRTRQQSHHSFDDTPPFSPSPPMYLSSGGNYIQYRLRSETAPVSIPNPLFTRHLSPNLSSTFSSTRIT